MTGYSVEIVEVSKELSAKERIQLKDTTDVEKLDTATALEEVVVDVDFYAELSIHNEHSEDKDYANYVLVDKDGTRYVTGSESFWSAFKNIYSEMENSGEDWQLKIYQMPSKNRQGKNFITCSVL